MRAELLRGRQKDLRGRHDLHVGNLRGHSHRLELPFLAAIAGEGEQILIIQVSLDFVEVGLHVHGHAEPEKVGLAPRLLRDAAQVGLPVESGKRTAAAAPAIGNIDRPDIDVLLLRVLDRGIHIWVERRRSTAEIIDARRKKKNGAAFACVWPTLYPILEREVWTRANAEVAQRHAHRFGSQCVVRGEILSHPDGAIPGVGHGDRRSARLGHDKRSQVIPLASNAASERIINQHGKAERVSAFHVGHLHALFSLIEREVVPGKCRRLGIFFGGRRDGHDDCARARCVGFGLCRERQRRKPDHYPEQQSSISKKVPVHMTNFLSVIPQY